MPLFVQGLINALKFGLPAIVGSFLGRLGIGVATFAGASGILDQVESAINSNLSGLPATVSQMLSVLHVPFAISILLAAVAFRFASSVSVRRRQRA